MKPRIIRRQLAGATLKLLVQYHLLAVLRKELLMIAQKIPPCEPVANELREQIGTLSCRSINWEKYDSQFRAMNPGFLYELIERAPELTTMEVRICTMVRMQLKSREMARLLGISESGVGWHRRSIRRKLNLKSETKLERVLRAM